MLRGGSRACPGGTPSVGSGPSRRCRTRGQPSKAKTFQDLILTLQNFWASKGCLILQPYDNEMGAGTFHPATTLRALGPRPWKAAYVQPSRRPDGRPLWREPQPAAALLSVSGDPEAGAGECAGAVSGVRSSAIGLDPDAARHPLCRGRLGKPHLGRLAAWAGKSGATGWRSPSSPISSRSAASTAIRSAPRSPMASSGWPCMSRMSSSSTTSPSTSSSATAKCSTRTKQEFSAYNFERADTEILFQHFKDAEKQCQRIADGDKKLALPAYDQCIKASHAFNLLDARGVISVTERAAYIGRVRALAQACCEAWLETPMGALQAPTTRGRLMPDLLLELVQRRNSRPHAGGRGARPGAAGGGRAVRSRLAVRRHQGVCRAAAADPGDQRACPPSRRDVREELKGPKVDAPASRASKAF